MLEQEHLWGNSGWLLQATPTQRCVRLVTAGAHVSRYPRCLPLQLATSHELGPCRGSREPHTLRDRRKQAYKIITYDLGGVVTPGARDYLKDLLAPLAFPSAGLKRRISGPAGRGPAPSQPLGDLRESGGARPHLRRQGSHSLEE